MPDMPRGRQQFAIQFDRADFVRMACADADCDNWRNGFVIVLDPTDEHHRSMCRAIETSGRRYARLVASTAAGYIDRDGANWGVDLVHLREVVGRALPHMLAYVFPPGQQCFKQHRDREVHFLNVTRDRIQTHSPLGYNEHWNQEMDQIARVIQRG